MKLYSVLHAGDTPGRAASRDGAGTAGTGDAPASAAGGAHALLSTLQTDKSMHCTHVTASALYVLATARQPPNDTSPCMHCSRFCIVCDSAHPPTHNNNTCIVHLSNKCPLDPMHDACPPAIVSTPATPAHPPNRTPSAPTCPHHTRVLAYKLLCASICVLGCTRLHLCDQNTPPACMHECDFHKYVRTEYGCST